MKIRFCFLVFAMTVLLVFCGCANRPDYANMEKSQLQASMLSPPDTLDKLLDRCHVVVQGILRNDAQTELKTNSTFGIEIINSGATKSTLHITKVLQAQEIGEGDDISIYEPYYAAEYNEKPCLFYLSNYLPAEPGKEYIFFFNEKESGGYIADAVEYSRYPVPETQAWDEAEMDSLTREELFLAEGADLEKYMALYKEVLDEYGES